MLMLDRDQSSLKKLINQIKVVGAQADDNQTESIAVTKELFDSTTLPAFAQKQSQFYKVMDLAG